MLKSILLITLLLLPSYSFSSSPTESHASLLNEPLVQAESLWQLPFSTPHALLRHYIQPTSDYSAGHRGIDIAAKVADEVVAPADGIIIYANHLVDRSVIVMNHGSGFTSELEPACADLPVGSTIRRGEHLGKVCSPDEAYHWHCPKVSCIHFSLRKNGKYLSPLALIGGLNPSRLLPYARG